MCGLYRAGYRVFLGGLCSIASLLRATLPVPLLICLGRIRKRLDPVQIEIAKGR